MLHRKVRQRIGDVVRDVDRVLEILEHLLFAQELLGIKSPSEALELCTAHTRKTFETLTAQAKELTELAQKVAAETVEPIKINAAKYYKPAA